MHKLDKLPWNKQFALDWGKYPSPVRPGLEMSVYKKTIENIIKNNPKAKILILGSTPEFRDLLLKFNISPICCDMNPEVHKALKRLMKDKGKEKLIKSDWLKLKTNKEYDLIIGHNVINMIPNKKVDLFIKNVSSCLKKGGYFLDRLELRPLKNEKIDPIAGFKKYRKKRINDSSRLFTMSYPDVVLHIGQKKGYYTPNDYIKVIKEMFKKETISKKEYGAMIEIVKPSKLKINLPYRNEIEKIFKKYFTIKDKIIISKEAFNPKYWPLYLLMKK